MYRHLSTLIACAMLHLAGYQVGVSEAAPRSWQDNGGSPNWGTALNWTPIGTPILSDNIQIGNIDAEPTQLDQNFSIDTLAISNGATLDTNGNQLNVTGDVLLSDVNTELVAQQYINNTTPAITADNITLLSGSRYQSTANSRSVFSGSFTINAGATLSGAGTIVADRIVNNSDIQPSHPVGQVLDLDTTGPGMINLDGTNETSSVNAASGSLRLHDPLLDPFDGYMRVSTLRRITFLAGGTIGSGGLVDVTGGTVFPAEIYGAPSATIDIQGTVNINLLAEFSDARFLSGATVNLTDADDEMSVTGSTASIASGVTFTGAGRIVVDDTTLTLDDGAQVAVEVEINGSSPGGTVRIGDGIADVEVLSYDPKDFGNLEIEIGGRISTTTIDSP